MGQSAAFEQDPFAGNVGVFPNMTPEFVAGEIDTMEEQFAPVGMLDVASTHEFMTQGEYYLTPPLGELVEVSEIDEGAEARAQHLQELEHSGFEANDALRTELIDDVVRTGMPVDNMRSVHLRENTERDKYTLGSFGLGEYHGQFSLYELLEAHPEARTGTIIHEGMHANSPFNVNNAEMYGGEFNRIAAAERAIDVANQTLVTGVHLNAYHESLAERTKLPQDHKDHLPLFMFAEETMAIKAEMALTNREGLRIKQEAQRHKLEDVNRERESAGMDEITFQPIVSSEKTGYVKTVNGYEKATYTVPGSADQTLINLLHGVNNLPELLKHAEMLKRETYRPENLEVANRRTDEDFTIMAFTPQIIEDARRRIDDLEDDEDVF